MLQVAECIDNIAGVKMSLFGNWMDMSLLPIFEELFQQLSEIPWSLSGELNSIETNVLATSDERIEIQLSVSEKVTLSDFNHDTELCYAFP
jgi:hypothetical protein